MTKSELRAERRAARETAERAAAATATRRRRLWRLAAAATAATILVAAAVAISAPNDSPAPKAATIVDGIPESNGVLGDPNAPVTVTEYVDLQCPVCASAAKETLPALIDDYVRTGKVKLQARTLSFLGPDSVRAARVAAGAERQGRLWAFLETFYAAQGAENSGYVTDAFLRDVAQAADAGAVNADSTPTFTVKRGDGAETIIGVGVTDLSEALDKALAA
jgi:protein-disulfide isomerase